MKYRLFLITLVLLGEFLAIRKNCQAQNIGIGVTNPAFKLDVNGRIRVKTGTIGNISTSSGIWLEDYRDGTNRAFLGMQDSIRVGFYGSGTGGVGWGLNFNTITGDLSIPVGEIGLGTITPAYDLHIYRPDPSIGFFDVNDNHFSGYMQGDSADLLINAHRTANVFPPTGLPGNLILQINGDGFIGSTAGNVGIGTSSPDIKLQVAGGTDVTGTGGGYIQLGNSNTLNVGIDNNEIQARDDGLAAKLTLQANGGGIQFGSGTGAINITSGGELNRTGITGSANLLPLAFGRVSGGGAIVNSTGNFTVQKVADGEYKITLTNEPNVYLNRNNYVILVTPYYTTVGIIDDAILANARIGSDNTIEVRITVPKVYYTNSSCTENCGPFSYISNLKFYDEKDSEFSILIYKF